ncbi:LCP family protein [Paenibacillus swuensis]|nr:LCP family protein [Paenibacillus swuensis]
MTSPKTTGMPSRAKKKPKKPRKLLRLFLMLMLIAGLGIAGFAGYTYFKLNGLLDEVAADDKEGNVVVPKEDLAEVKPKTILLLGLDSRKETHTMLTDVIMVITMNPQTKSATVVSIPRDTRMEVTGFNRVSKANSYYAAFHNKNDYSDPVEANMKSFFGQYLDVPIDYVSVVNFNGFKDVINAVGGIDVNVDMDMRYVDTADGTDIDLKKGQQELNGDEALDYVRYRKSNKGTGASSDLERNQRQQEVIHQLLNKIKSVEGVVKVGGIFDAVGNNIETDIPSQQLTSFIKTYMGINNDNIEYVPLEGTWRSPYIRIDEEQLEAAKSKLKARLGQSE